MGEYITKLQLEKALWKNGASKNEAKKISTRPYRPKNNNQTTIINDSKCA